MNEKKVATEVAEAEFCRWAESMDLNLDPRGWDDEDKKSFHDAKFKLVAAIEAGNLVVDEKGRMVYTPRSTESREPLVFNEPTGGHMMSMDQKKKGHDMAKLFGIMAEMTGQNIQVFTAMKSRDLKVCQSIVALFLGS